MSQYEATKFYEFVQLMFTIPSGLGYHYGKDSRILFHSKSAPTSRATRHFGLRFERCRVEQRGRSDFCTV